VGAPIAVSLGFSSFIMLEINDLPLLTMVDKIFENLDSFTIMAIPFFILSGNIMTTGGISKRLMNFANALVVWFRGGLGAVTILTSGFFASMSGSSSATTAAIGSILIPEMERKKYPKAFAAATVGTSGELGSIIPPSIAMIVYGVTVNVSIGNLFLAGLIPGILIMLSLIVTVIVTSRIKNYDIVYKTNIIKWGQRVLKTFKEALLALIMPVIILGGIYSGIFTPTEASVVAVVYGFIVSY